MTKNPIVNALSASVYIVLIVCLMTFGMQPLRNKPDTFFSPIVFLSVFTLSAAVMTYLFFYQPVILLIDGKKKDAVNLFVKTVGVFGMITILAVVLLFLGVF